MKSGNIFNDIMDDNPNFLREFLNMPKSTSVSSLPSAEVATTFQLQNGKSKIERFGWEVVGAPPEQRMIDKGKLRVDHSYQREPTETKVQLICNGFDWCAFGSLLVAERADGSLYVYDGWNRLTAARRRPDVSLVPCSVVKSLGAEFEARSFLAGNTQRKPLSIFQKFKAMIMTNDPAAIHVLDMVEKAGYTISTNNSLWTVKCVHTLLFCHSHYGECFERIWQVCVDTYGGKSLHERAIRGLCYLEQRISPHGLSLSKEPWKSRVLKLGPDGLHKAISDSCSFYHRGGDRIYATGIMNTLNKGLRYRLSFDGIESNESSESKA